MIPSNKSHTTSTVPCSNGANCSFLKTGTCKYLHNPTTQSIIRPSNKLSNPTQSQHNQAAHSSTVIPCPGGDDCSYQKAGNCAYFHGSKPQVAMPSSVKPQQQQQKDTSKTPCSKGDECSYFKAGKCNYLHETKPQVFAQTNPTILNSTSANQPSKDTSKIPCSNGDDCTYFKAGNCNYLHTSKPQVFAPIPYPNILPQSTQKPIKDPTTIPCPNGDDCPHNKSGKCNYLHIETSSSIIDRFMAKLTQPSQSTNPTAKDTSKIPCSNGNECSYFKAGKCNYLHEIKPQVFAQTKPTILNSMSANQPHKDTSKISCSNGDDCTYFQAGKCNYLHTPKTQLFAPILYPNILPQPIEKSIKDPTMIPCSNGNDCPYYKAGKCKYLHTQASSPQIGAFLNIGAGKSINQINLSQPSQSTNQIVKDTSKIPCSNGDDCSYFKAGRCNYLHEVNFKLLRLSS